uniref:Zinc finger protein 358 n=1 Tax=Cacopsylla melanoneura TaxID=428564 RepID=A0A8D8VHW7_9HEMI
MSDQPAFTSTIKSEPEPGLYVTTYTTRNIDEQESVLRVIEREPLDIPCDAEVKEEPLDIQDTEPVDEPLDNTPDTLEEDELVVQNVKEEKVSSDCNTEECCSIIENPATQIVESHLKAHLYTHEEPRHPCHKCSKTFSEKRTLKKHLLAHKGIRYPCEKCSKSFSEKWPLNRHLLTHLLRACVYIIICMYTFTS